MKQYKNTIQSIQNTVNTGTHITRTPTQLSKHPIYSHPHITKQQNNHRTRHTPNEIVTIHLITLSIMVTLTYTVFLPQELNRNSLHFTSLKNKNHFT
jgi:hypothetical protein